MVFLPSSAIPTNLAEIFLHPSSQIDFWVKIYLKYIFEKSKRENAAENLMDCKGGLQALWL